MARLYNLYASINIGGRIFKSPPFHVEFEQQIQDGIISATALRLYNPNQDTLNVASGRTINYIYYGPTVTITAGYEEDYGTCSIGQAIQYEIKREHSDLVLTMRIMDQGISWQIGMINKWYMKQTASNIMRQIIIAAGITPGKIEVGKDAMRDKFYARSLFQALNDLCRMTESTFCFNNGLLEVHPSEPSTQNTIFDLSPDTGLVGIPEKTQMGIKFQTLFFYKLQPLSYVKITSQNINGIYRIYTGKKRFSTLKTIESEWEATKAS